MQQEIKLRGAGLLKVVSIIMIIMGVISAVSGVITMGSGGMLVSVFGMDEFAAQYFRVLGVLSLVTGIVMLVFGVFGVKLHNRAEKAGFLLVLGIINIVIMAFSVLYNSVMAPMWASIVDQITQSAGVSMYPTNISGMAQSVPLMVPGFILPALFILGAMLNRTPQKGAGLGDTQASPESDPAYEAGAAEGYHVTDLPGEEEDASEEPQSEDIEEEGYAVAEPMIDTVYEQADTASDENGKD